MLCGSKAVLRRHAASSQRKRPVSSRSRALSPAISASGDAPSAYSFDQGKAVETVKTTVPSLFEMSSGSVPSSVSRSLPST